MAGFNEYENAGEHGSQAANLPDGIAADVDWAEANLRYLSASLNGMLLALEKHAGQARENHVELEELAYKELRASELALPGPSSLHMLSAAFELTAFERGILLLCTATELDGRFSALCSAIQGEGKAYATFSLALALLPEADIASLGPAGALRHWRLIEVGPGTVLTSSPLRIDERILQFLIGEDEIDDRLPVTRSLSASVELWHLSEDDRVLARKMAEAWTSGASPALELYGGNREQRRAIIRSACEILDIDRAMIPARSLQGSSTDMTQVVRLWNRETMLGDIALQVECDDMQEGLDRPLIHWMEEITGPLVISTAERRVIGEAATLYFEAPKVPARLQIEAWQEGLGANAAGMAEEIERLVVQFDSVPALISTACGALRRALENDDVSKTPEGMGAWLWSFCRDQARLRLEGVAARVSSSVMWGDLILPALQEQMLHEIALRVKHRSTVYEQWGFAARSHRGLGVTALFAGTSGTGKTLAAEVLANELRLDLYRIDLSAVVSKYIGETEKNLRRVFDAAEAGGAILLFDEADALFGKRSEVKDSHDRHSNIEVSYLLQRMEAYRGLAIMTTNLKQALDVGFLRRIQYVVDFPFPGIAERVKIWQRSFPSSAPMQGIDMQKLARLNMSGGNIRNISLTAAFLAAESKEAIQMKHLALAARSESIKLEKTLSDAEIRDWV